MMPSCRIMLAGNPNVGKSTVFNALTGLKQHTGNWSGKTVTLATGSFRYGNQTFEIQDLPGTYSIISNSPEEEVARDAIAKGDATFTLVVADATCLARNLNLALQILEITPNVALCVNLLDEAKRKQIEPNLNKLSQMLSVPVIGISAQNRRDITRLKEFLANLAQTGFPSSMQKVLVTYPQPIEDALANITTVLGNDTIFGFSKRFLALRLLENDNIATNLLNSQSIPQSQRQEIFKTVETMRKRLKREGVSSIVFRDQIVGALIQQARDIAKACVPSAKEESITARPVDRFLTSKIFGIPIMLGFLGVILWITISGANVPSQVLMNFFFRIKPFFQQFLAFLQLPEVLVALLSDGVYQTVAWVTAVMLPPLVIFFPLFTLLEDLGYLPRLAFNLDCCFKRFGSCGKQALTMCMGLGCNAVGVTGCRIITSKRERLTAMITNCFIPCNGRFSMLITLSGIFIGCIFCQGMQTLAAAIFLLFLILIGVFMTLIITKLLTRFYPLESPTPFSLELSPYRRPRITQILTLSLFDRTWHILTRALRVSAPAGALIWLMANLQVDGLSLLAICADFLNPFGKLIGMDGMILLAFILAIPANEIVLPILLMGYLATGQMSEMSSLIALKELLLDHGWTTLTAINVMLFSVLHFPCATTLWTIKKESGSLLWTFFGFLIPTITAIFVCFVVTGIWRLCIFLI